MGLVNEVRKVGGTAPIGTAPGSPAAEPAPASTKATGDQASLTAHRAYAYGAPSQAPDGRSFLGRLFDSAGAMWGRVVRLLTPAPRPTPAPTPAPQPAQPAIAGTTAEQALDSARTAYELEVASKIQEAQDQQKAEQRKWDDPRYEQMQLRKHMREAAERARNSDLPLTASQQAVTGYLTQEAELREFKALSADERDQFVTVFKAVGGDWEEQNEFTRKASDGLRLLLTNGRLIDEDAKGGELLATLAAHAGKPLAKALDGSSLDQQGQLQNLVNMIAYPDQVFQGDNTNTCVAASLQTVMAQNDPAELARVAAGLIWEGQVALQSGDVMTLSTDELHKPDGGRSTTSQLIQGSFREFGRQFSPEPGYDAEPEGEYGGGRRGGRPVFGKGRYASRPTFGGGRYVVRQVYGGGRYGGRPAFGAGRYGGRRVFGGGEVAEGAPKPGSPAASVPGGLTQYQAQELFERVVGKLAVPVPVHDRNRQQAWSGVERALEAGWPIPAGVTGVDDKGQPIYHEITILAIEGDEVTLADSGSGESRKFPISRVLQDLNALVLPAEFADHTGWNIEENADNPGDANGDYGGGRFGPRPVRP